jgi:hypothetical protein
LISNRGMQKKTTSLISYTATIAARVGNLGQGLLPMSLPSSFAGLVGHAVAANVHNLGQRCRLSSSSSSFTGNQTSAILVSDIVGGHLLIQASPTTRIPDGRVRRIGGHDGRHTNAVRWVLGSCKNGAPRTCRANAGLSQCARCLGENPHVAA